MQSLRDDGLLVRAARAWVGDDQRRSGVSLFDRSLATDELAKAKSTSTE